MVLLALDGTRGTARRDTAPGITLPGSGEACATRGAAGARVTLLTTIATPPPAAREKRWASDAVARFEPGSEILALALERAEGRSARAAFLDEFAAVIDFG